MSRIGVKYGDSYAVRETFQLLKIPWEWYDPSGEYDVVIAGEGEVPGFRGPVVDLTATFDRVRRLLNEGEMHLRTPSVERLMDELRSALKRHTLLLEIPPSPWGHPYMVALTHDVDRISVRQSSWKSSLVGAARCFLSLDLAAGMRILLAKAGAGEDPWWLFPQWRELEEKLGVRSTFYLIPPSAHRCIRGYHPYREVSYHADRGEVDALRNGGWEVGIHGMNWDDAEALEREKESVPGSVGNRTHWLLHNGKSWALLDAAGYGYDTTFGYDDDAGYRSGTTQVYQPEHAAHLLELPLHIQDMGLFGTSCWAWKGDEWVKLPCLHLTEDRARDYVERFLPDFRSFGGVLTLLWHYEDLAPPRTWMMGTYLHLVEVAKRDHAWLTTAENVVSWFRIRRKAEMEYSVEGKRITITVKTPPRPGHIPEQRVRLHINPSRIRHIDGEFVKGDSFVDILCKPEITVECL